jgi:hypothetical protein
VLNVCDQVLHRARLVGVWLHSFKQFFSSSIIYVRAYDEMIFILEHPLWLWPHVASFVRIK